MTSVSRRNRHKPEHAVLYPSHQPPDVCASAKMRNRERESHNTDPALSPTHTTAPTERKMTPKGTGTHLQEAATSDAGRHRQQPEHAALSLPHHLPDLCALPEEKEKERQSSSHEAVVTPPSTQTLPHWRNNGTPYSCHGQQRREHAALRPSRPFSELAGGGGNAKEEQCPPQPTTQHQTKQKIEEPERVRGVIYSPQQTEARACSPWSVTPSFRTECARQKDCPFASEEHT